MQNYPNYYAVLTADVRYCPELSAQEKLLYAEISALSNKEGYCFAGNGFFAELYGLSGTTISHQISHLEKLGFIKITFEKTGAKVNKRIITVAKNRNGEGVTVANNSNRTVAKNRKDNNTSNNNITRLNNITDQSVQLVNIFVAGLKRRNPKIDRSDIQKVHYASVYDSLLETYTYYELAQMTNFVFNSDFWSKFVLTVDMLKKHVEKLYAQCKDYYKITEDVCEDENVDF